MRSEGIKLVHADDALLVLDKPAGLLSVPGLGVDKRDCLSARVQSQFPDALVVHRLDMATSGLMLMARGRPSQLSLNRAFADRQIDKKYVALVTGLLAPPNGAWGVIELAITVDWPNRPRRVVNPMAGKACTTRWRVLPGGDATCTRVELSPVTGRSHQLRVHMQAIGHPILGDALYSVPTSAFERLMLHATEIAFMHPLTGDPMAFRSAPDF